MAVKLMFIPNHDTQSYPFYRLHLVVETFGQYFKLSKNELYFIQPNSQKFSFLFSYQNLYVCP